ncbi:MAG: hypothetical protein M9904_08830 [Chitinophagaceae bacterium]|nr:hypothetical protein [Chitinophagaceae bacterium]
MKRFMYRFFLLMAVFICLCNGSLYAQNELPVGSHPPALQFDHFPGKLYAVVWRNWNLVTPERIALTIGATPRQVREIAALMGLPPSRPLTEDFHKRIYITVIRRNWHLLPYNQLLTLLDISEKQLEFILKEDDFLYIKLGSLKPDCAEVLYTSPDKKVKKQLAGIKKIAKQYFADPSKWATEQPFDFVQTLQQMPEKNTGTKEVAPDQLRFIYSYFGIFGDPLIDTLHDPYPDGLLARLAEKGVTGVWMHVVLSQLAPPGTDFPEFGEGHEKRIANLKRIAQRAKKYGISVYLYMNEPRAMPPAFFKNRPEMAGARQGDFQAMCTAHPAVAKWLAGSLTYIFTAIPELGGVFTITASENYTHCASHNNQKTCVRCSKRDYAEIIADVNAIICRGVHAGNPAAKVIVWDWGWHNHGLAKDIITRLPKEVWLMSVSEWAKDIERGGIRSAIGEYSISAVGPGSRSQQHWAWAKEYGLKTVAKVQFNNTWELSALPWLPVSYLVAQHAAQLAKAGVDGLMLSWSLGGYPSPNLEIARAFDQHPGAAIDTVLNRLAIQRYGIDAAPYILRAWKSFSDGFSEFPYHISTVYSAPQQYGPANLLYETPTGYKATMVGIPYDDLTSWRSIYPPDVFVQQMKKVADGWQTGLRYFEEAIPFIAAEHNINAKQDRQIARAAWLHFSSVANQSMFVIYRDSLLKHAADAAVSGVLRRQLAQILEDEINNAGSLFEIAGQDSRIGFEASNQYYYVEQDLVEKVLNCRRLLMLYR